MHIGFLVRSPTALTEAWTTTHWMAAALAHGHHVWVLGNRDLLVDERGWSSRCSALSAPLDPAGVAAQLAGRRARRTRIDLMALDVLLLRTAPLDPAVLAAAVALEQRGLRVVNAPLGVLAVSHKSWLASLDLPTPPTVVTSYRGDAHAAHGTWGDVVVKPDRGSGGALVTRVRRGDVEGLDDAFTAAAGPRGRVVIQPLLDGSRGERRLLWCDGEIVGGYLRTSAAGDFRHNLKQGATASRVELSAADLALGPLLTPHLAPLGIRFAGLDVLSERLVEVNALNPGGTVFADALHGTRLAEAVMGRLLEGGPRRPEPRRPHEGATPDGHSPTPHEEAGGGNGVQG
ncbi:MAG: hypothetical protein KC656_06200 [Myxococcales bacterium]|nr:hypothetical protein [Myxococcales bacterium]MCB9668993.1 hypothetical protein [Alphaproteobacteria bacterium]MCB9691320.1 hypothetical protein [Alphaproteobacteria bacterium]